MNFTEVLNANGQLITMLATVLEVGASKLNVNQKPYQSARLRDDTGTESAVTINKGTGLLLNNACLNQRLQFAMQTYQGQRGAAFSGYWNNTAQVAPQKTLQYDQPAPGKFASADSYQPSSTPQRPQQATPVAPKSTQAPQPARNSRDESIERQNALRHADSAYRAGAMCISEYQEWAEMCLHWIQTGQWESKNERETAKAITEPQDDGIPF